uniref:Uncharacterized protein n=1 Tax=Siphoviridae sp. ctDXu9 TaxID=2825387 RepID=A0A8S5VD79_9CAUD|nr:MAG TPA: hypothetical protein [Siphoviridae sp. ctDXu9]
MLYFSYGYYTMTNMYLYKRVLPTFYTLLRVLHQETKHGESCTCRKHVQYCHRQ